MIISGNCQLRGADQYCYASDGIVGGRKINNGKNSGGMLCRMGLILLLLLLAVEEVSSSSRTHVGVLKLHRTGLYAGIHEKSSCKDGSCRSGKSQSLHEFRKRVFEQDRARHRRFLSSTAVDFPLGGTSDPYGAGLYFTEVGLGNPPKPYIVQVDTGSDVLWVNCQPCPGCPGKSGLGIPMSYYSPQSPSSRPLPCSDSFCDTANSVHMAKACASAQETCPFSLLYGDGSTARGFYVRDTFQYNHLDGSNANTTTEVVFGCSLNRSGDLSTSVEVFDGIMGFGPSSLSVPSQLYSQGKAPHRFAHCLEEDSSGGGILIMGDVIVSGMQYTPFVPNNLESTFPPVTLDFEGATMHLKPKDYMFNVPSQSASLSSNIPVWCVGWRPSDISISGSSMTVLGDMILHNKMVVYDLENSRIGFVDYNCSSGVTLSTSRGKQWVPSTHIYNSAGIRIFVLKWTLVWLLLTIFDGVM